MFGHKDTLLYKLRYFVVAVLIIANLLLVTMLVSAIATASDKNAARQAQAGQVDVAGTSNASQYDDPNVVAGGVARMADSLNRGINAAGRIANNGLQFIARTAAQNSQSAARLARNCAIFAARNVAGSVDIIVRTPGEVLGFMSDTTGVSAIIQPGTQATVPIIDPHAAVLAASASLPAAQSQAQPQPKVQPASAAASNAAAIWPVHGNITTLFGVPHWPYQPTHTGLDISSGQRSGATAIKPFKPGRVIETVRSYSGLGNHVIVDHGGGMTSVYAHLASIAVSNGQEVAQDTVLGHEGSTGASTGTHLHFEIRLHGQPVDPRPYL